MRIPLPIVLPLILLAAPAFGAEAPSTAANHSPTGVARIAVASGNVAIYQLGQTDWRRAAIDQPVASGAWLATDANSRAEIRLAGDAIDVADGTRLNLADLRGKVLQLAISQGRIAARLQQAGDRRSNEIDIPSGAVWLNAPGTYDVTVGTDGQPTRIAVFDGSARFAGGGLDQTIPAGNALVLRQAEANLAGSVEPAKPDEFVKWARLRDRDERQLASRGEPPPAIEPNSGSTGPQGAAEPEMAAGAAAPPPHHARATRHRRIARHHYARVFHHRHYGYARAYGYAPAPVVTPFSVFHSLLSVIR